MERYCSTGQSPERAVAPTQEEEEEEEEEEERVICVSSINVCYFYTFKNWDHDFPCIFTICQFVPSAGQVGARADVRQNAFPYFYFLLASDLCSSDCCPRMFALTRALLFS
jgi:hypothetical protein